MGAHNESNSNREAKRQRLLKELSHWGYDGFDPGVKIVMNVIANELPWTMVVRIIHKLQRMRESSEIRGPHAISAEYMDLLGT